MIQFIEKILKNYLYKILYLTIIGYLLGLVLFIKMIPNKKQQLITDIDAVIMVTGDKDRVSRTKSLIQNSDYKLYFISGVGAPKYLKKYLNSNNKQTLVISTKAQSTHENAVEIGEWVQQYNLTKILLVTSNYHIPRTKMLIEYYSPKLNIEIEPTFNFNFNLSNWYKSSFTLKILLSEYTKYLLQKMKFLIT